MPRSLKDSWMLIHLNTAIEGWETVNNRFSRAHSGIIPGCMAVTIYPLFLIAAFIGSVIWVFGSKCTAQFQANARILLDDNKGNQ